MNLGTADQLAVVGAIVAILAGVAVLIYALTRGKVARAAGVDPEQARLLADMRELTDRLVGDLDRKSARLETLLGEADRRTAALHAELGAARIRETKPGAAGLTRENGSAAGETLVQRVESERLEPMHASVHSLSDRGLSPVEIAERTGVPTGQVELILALRRAGAR